jgi:hypothetical protein
LIGWCETWLDNNFSSSLILHVELNGFIDLMKTIPSVDHGLEFVLIHGLGLENNLKVLCQRLFRDIIVQKEGFDDLAFPNKSYGVDTSRWLVREQAIEKQCRLETHELKDFSCHVTGDAL